MTTATDRKPAAELDAEALSRAETGHSWRNYPAIMAGFAARGIPESEIRPRENVFTYRAWRAKGRQVRRGEHGVKVETYRDCAKTETDPQTGRETTKHYRRPWRATVFHVTQTDAA